MAKLSQKSNDRITFLCYAPGADGGGFDAWYSSLPPEVQAEVDAALETLQKSKRPWPASMYEALHGSCYGLTEIKIAVQHVADTNDDPSDEDDPEHDHYRILAWEGPSKKQVTLLVGFKKENNSDYAAPCRSALRRRDGVKKDERRARVWDVP